MQNPAPTITLDLIAASDRVKRSRGEASLEDAKSRVPRNVLSNWSSYAVNLLVVFLIGPLLVHRLGNMAYGVWALIGQTVEYSFLLDFGIRIAATRYVARYLALGKPEEVNRVITSGLFLSSFSAALALAGGGVFAWVLPRFFSIPPSLVSDARLTVLLCSVGIAVAFPGSIFNGCVTAGSRYDLLGIRKAAPGVVRLLLLWLLLKAGGSILTVAVVTTLAILVGYGLDLIFALRIFPRLRVRREFLDRSMLKTLLSFSLYAFVISVAYRVIFMTDNIVVGFALGPVAVTFYTVGMQLPGVLSQSVGNITMIYAPLAYQMDALDQKGSLRRLLVSGSRVAVLSVLPGVLGLAILGPRFLGLWMGDPFVRASGPILILLSVEALFNTLSFASVQVLYGINRPKVNAWLSLGNAAANLALSITLVRWVGAVGVAWGTVIPAFLVEGIILPVYTARLLQVAYLRFYKSAVLRPLVLSVPYGLWLWFCREQGSVRGYASLALAVGSGLLLYVFLAWRFGLDSEEKAWAGQRLSSLKLGLAAIRAAWGTSQGM